MPRTPTFPVCFDEVRQVTITSLRRRGLLNPNGRVSGSYGWTRGGKSFYSIGVIGNLPERWVEFDYIYEEKRINYRVHLESLPKKMGGCEWYFTCPATGRRCRKLYGIGGRFLSRFAYPSVMYSAQIESKGYRDFFTAYRNIQREREHFSKRHARTKYKGKPTKRYQRIVDKIDRIDTSALKPMLKGELPLLKGELPFLKGELPFLKGELPTPCEVVRVPATLPASNTSIAETR